MIIGILPLVSGVELLDEEATVDTADLLFLLPLVVWLIRLYLFTFPRGIFGELNCKFHVGLLMPRNVRMCRH